MFPRSLACAPASRFPSRNFPCIVGRTDGRTDETGICGRRFCCCRCSRRRRLAPLKMQMSPQHHSSVGGRADISRERGRYGLIQLCKSGADRSDPTAAAASPAGREQGTDGRGRQMHNVQGYSCDGPSSRLAERHPQDKCGGRRGGSLTRAFRTGSRKQ